MGLRATTLAPWGGPKADITFVGQFTGSGAVSIGSVVGSGSATFAAPVYTASASVTIGAASGAGSATFTTPVFSATGAVVVGATLG